MTSTPRRRHVAKASCPFVVLAWTLSAPLALAADKRDEEAARLFFTGEYERALKIYVDLALEKKNPGYMCNIGRCQARLGRVDDAIHNVRDCLGQAKLDAKKRAEYQSLLDELTARKGAGPAPTAPAGPVAATPAPGGPATPVPAAPLPAPSAGAPSTAPVQTQPAVPSGPAPAAATASGFAPGPTADPASSDSPPVAPSPVRPAARPAISGKVVVAGAAGLLGVATGVTFGLLASSAYADVSDVYDPERERTAGSYNKLQIVGYGLGAIGLGTAVVLHLLAPGPNEERTSSRPRVFATVAPGGGGIGWTF